MGTTASKGASSSVRTELRHVFARELADVTSVVNHIVSVDNKFVAPDYNFLTRDTCNSYTFALQSQLSKHLKVDVQELHDSLILIPTQDRVATGSNNRVINKSQLCDVVSKHYIKILYVLCLVKYVYNLEHAGDYSIAGIIRRNVRTVGDLLEVNYCSLQQREYNRVDKRVDFGALKGMRFFVDNFLSPEEHSDFLKHLKMVVSRRVNSAAIDRLACADGILSRDDYQSFYGKPPVCPKNDLRVLAVNQDDKEDLLFDVSPFNPVLSSTMCMSKKKLVVQLGSDDKTTKDIRAAHDKMHANYVDNLDQVNQLLDRFVQKKTTKGSTEFTLRTIDDKELADIVSAVKRIVIKFYVKSVLDYQTLLDLCRRAPGVEMEA